MLVLLSTHKEDEMGPRMNVLGVFFACCSHEPCPSLHFLVEHKEEEVASLLSANRAANNDIPNKGKKLPQ